MSLRRRGSSASRGSRIGFAIAAIGVFLAAPLVGGARAAPPPPRIVVAGLTFPTGGARSGPIATPRAFPNLTFDRPVALAAPADGTDRIFVVEQGGRVKVFANDDRVGVASVYLDIAARVRAGGEEGLLGLAFDPDYARNGEVYLFYTAAGLPRRSVLSRFRVSANDPDRADPGSEEVILVVPQPFETHNGGAIAFGPDGMLYVALGDGGSAGDPLGHGQDLTTLLGAILRIDLRGGSPYAIPTDNPFFGRGGGIREEIYAFGLRNPWRFSFDRATGALWAGDVGQDAFEEIDLIERGSNLGWRVFEGDRPFLNPANLPASSFTRPVITYGRADGRCVIGGHVYRGSQHANLRGTYFYADFVSSRIFALVHDGTGVVSNTTVGQVASPSSFGEDEAGELYVLSYGGTVHRIEPSGGGGGAPFPRRLSDTGLFSDLATLTPTPGVLEYEVNAPLWSDGAVKRRFIALPGNDRIDFDERAPWRFPVGTVLVKHFELPLDVTRPSGPRRRLETRVFVQEQPGWAGYTYVWNAAQSDADLIDARRTDAFTVADPAAPGGTRQQTWTFPGRSDCTSCHTAAAGSVLGVTAPQLHRGGPTGPSQLAAFDGLGLLDRTPDLAAVAALVDPHDARVDLDRRARSYLDANCAGCHRPGGPTPVTLDLRASTPLLDTGLVARPAAGDLGLGPDAAIVRPGDRARSVLVNRVARRDAKAMPPLGSHLVDAAGVALLGDWADALPPPPAAEVTFAVTMPRTVWGETVMIVGDDAALGRWRPRWGARLDTTPWSFPVWTGKVRLPTGRRIRWKAVIRGIRGELWELGSDRDLHTDPAGLPTVVTASFRDEVPTAILARAPRALGAGETLRVVGADAALGRWDPAAAPALGVDPADPTLFRGRIVLPSRMEHRLKLVIVGAGGGVTWENGADRSLIVPAQYHPYSLDLGAFR